MFGRRILRLTLVLLRQSRVRSANARTTSACSFTVGTEEGRIATQSASLPKFGTKQGKRRLVFCMKLQKSWTRCSCLSLATIPRSPGEKNRIRQRCSYCTEDGSVQSLDSSGAAPSDPRFGIVRAPLMRASAQVAGTVIMNEMYYYRRNLDGYDLYFVFAPPHLWS